ncbi:MAG: cobalt ECF transporter T component CbiQ [Acidobacteriota bacterium]|jgi:cobalt/nickel transport system permease protein|nr:cobalt ECF transporter T component CbiQ [Acidobacteriota bacterium]
MSDISARVHEIRALENLAAGRTAIHRLHPLAKLFSALVFIVFVASFGRYDFARLAPYLFYPFIMMALAELPYRLLLPRVLIALPFCLFAGISNVVFDKAAAFSVGGVTVSLGVLSLATILLKMYLCVMAALLLVATTPFTELTAQMRRLCVPMVFVMVFEMTFRYIGVLLEEVHSMTMAYKLRSGNKKALEMRHMGSFVGQLLLRGFDRAERVHAAMRCRGYSLKHVPPSRRQFKRADALALAAVCLPSLLLRFITVW